MLSLFARELSDFNWDTFSVLYLVLRRLIIYDSRSLDNSCKDYFIVIDKIICIKIKYQ